MRGPSHPFIRLSLLVSFCLLGCSEQKPNRVAGKKQPGFNTRQGITRIVSGANKTSVQQIAPTGILPSFLEIAQSAGVNFRRYDDLRGQHRIVESLGGGVGLFDYDGDGLLDIFLTNGCPLPKKTEVLSYSNALYRNQGNGRFVRVTAEAALLQYGYCHGCAIGDFNEDGFEDLYVTAFGRNVFWRNEGDGTFSDVTEETRSNVDLWSTSAAFADVNSDGILDLYVVNYLETRDDPPRLCRHRGSPDGYIQCAPEMFSASNDVLFLGNGQGQFLNGTLQAGLNAPDGKGLGVVIFDANRDGRPDIYVANDGTPNFLYVNQPPTEPAPHPRITVPFFLEQGTAWGAGLNCHGLAEAGMGIACGDYDADGWIDLFVTHFYRETNTVYRNLAGRGFADETRSTGLSVPSLGTLGFGTEFFDYDNDGWLDLFVANGHVDDRRWMNQPYRMPAQVFRNEQNGRFTDVSQWAGSYFRDQWLGRGVAVGDLENDGDLDLVVSHQLDPSAILQNNTTAGYQSVILKLVGRGDSNRSAIGARVEVHGLKFLLHREIIGGGSFQSSSDRRIHIGLEKRKAIEKLTIHWPSGEVDERQNVTAGVYIAVEKQTLRQLP